MRLLVLHVAVVFVLVLIIVEASQNKSLCFDIQSGLLNLVSLVFLFVVLWLSIYYPGIWIIFIAKSF